MIATVFRFLNQEAISDVEGQQNEPVLLEIHEV